MFLSFFYDHHMVFEENQYKNYVVIHMNLVISTAVKLMHATVIIIALVERSFIKHMQTNAQKTRRVLV